MIALFFLPYSPLSLLPLYGGGLTCIYYKSFLILALFHPSQLLRRMLSLVTDDETGCSVGCRVA